MFLREIAFINRYLGDRRALEKTLLADVDRSRTKSFSVLDVGCGSGQLLATIADFARRRSLKATLTGIDLNQLSTAATNGLSSRFPEISTAQADAFALPFGDNAFDYAISSLFFHHLTNEQIPELVSEMARVTRLGFYVIDLHRHPAAYILYRVFCFAFGISRLVTDDGSLSILRGFKPQELKELCEHRRTGAVNVTRKAMYRVAAFIPNGSEG